MLSEPIRVANGGAYALAEIGDMSDANRTLMFVMLGTIVVTNAIWQAAGLALARLENLILPRRKTPENHD
jgi:hypothetical protein